MDQAQFRPVLQALEEVPLTFQPAWVEQNGRGEDILVFSCKELPKRDFIYVPGRRHMTLGWDIHDARHCALTPGLRAAFRQGCLDRQAYDREQWEDEIAYCREQLAREELTPEQRAEYEEELGDAEEELARCSAQSWEDRLQAILAELDCTTSPLRWADIPPMLAERRAWNTPETVQPPFSLPTEDEWEYLCSGGVHQLFPWGDSLDLDAIGREDIDKDGKNAFGLVIGNDCRAEQVEGTHILKGDDGGIYLGGGDVELAALPYSPYFRYVHPYYWRSVPSGEPPAFHRRRVLRLPFALVPGTAR